MRERAICLVLFALLGSTQALSRAVLGFNPMERFGGLFGNNEDYDDDDYDDEYDDEEEGGGLAPFLAKAVVGAGVLALGGVGATFAARVIQKKREELANKPRAAPKVSLSRQSRQQVQIKGGKGADTPAKGAAASTKTGPPEEEEEEEEDKTVYESIAVVPLVASSLSEKQKNHPLAQLLGAKLASYDESQDKIVELATADALDGKHVAVCFYLKSYDKAELGKILKTMKEQQAQKGNKFEVVLVDLTPLVSPKKVDEAWFQQAVKATGGLAVPSEGNPRALVEIFQKIQPKRSPTNVFMAMVDPTGNVVNPSVFLDMQLIPENFPWKYLPPLELLKSTGSLINSKNQTVDPKTLEGKVVGLYFSGSWCAPCKEFTKTLKTVYQQLHDADKPFEVVLVGVNDPSPNGYAYLQTMPWLAVPPDAALRLTRIISAAEIQAVPTLLIYDEKGELITPHGVARLMQEGAEYPWRVPPVVELSQALPVDVELLSRPCLMLFMEGASDETQAALSKAMTALQTEEDKEEKPAGAFPRPVQFLTAKKSSELGNRLRSIFKLESVAPMDKFLKSKAATNRPALVLLEMYRSRYYLHPVEEDLTEEGIKGLLQKFKDGSLEWQKLGGDESPEDGATEA